MTHECGCRQCAPADALIRAEMAEHRADFERFWEAMHRKPLPPIEFDHESAALAETRWRETIAVPAVRRIG